MPSEYAGYRYYLRGYNENGALRFEDQSSRKHLAIARSIYDLDGPTSKAGRWKISEEMWPEIARTLDWPEWQEGLEYFLESESVNV